MDQMIQPSNADTAPQESAQIPVANAGIEATTGQEGNLFPPGGGESNTNVEGLPQGQTAPIQEQKSPLG